ncbi:MAG: hypothetical protein IPK82_02970 [Polyangiaceae bacterium]|nr:hypothetical protein [Polyangiaceae bacterium]
MSETNNDPPETPHGEEPEAKPSRGPATNVISIEQARNELLGRKRSNRTPPRGVDGPPKSRSREAPPPVTLPPGDNASVVVAGSAAARAHIDKKTVHPAELPAQTHEKKVRVKTSLDPRRAKTQLTDRRVERERANSTPPPAPAALGEDEVDSLWHTPSQPPRQTWSSIPPRPSTVRTRTDPREKQGGTLFIVGVMVAAALGAIVVYFLSRGGAVNPTVLPSISSPLPPASSAQANAKPAVPTAVSTPSAAQTAVPAVSATQTVSQPAEKPAFTAVAKPTPSSAPTLLPTAKPTATSVLPFGKDGNE